MYEYITDSHASHFLIAETRFELQYERVPVCSRELSSSSALHGVVASPNYPDLYPNYADCFTHIVPPRPPSIDFVLRGLVLQFHSFALEESASSAGRLTLLQSCTYDWLEVQYMHIEITAETLYSTLHYISAFYGAFFIESSHRVHTDQ